MKQRRGRQGENQAQVQGLWCLGKGKNQAAAGLGKLGRIQVQHLLGQVCLSLSNPHNPNPIRPRPAPTAFTLLASRPGRGCGRQRPIAIIFQFRQGSRLPAVGASPQDRLKHLLLGFRGVKQLQRCPRRAGPVLKKAQRLRLIVRVFYAFAAMKTC